MWHLREGIVRGVEAEEGGEVDGAAVAMTRLAHFFVQSKSHKLCVQRRLGKG